MRAPCHPANGRLRKARRLEVLKNWKKQQASQLWPESQGSHALKKCTCGMFMLASTFFFFEKRKAKHIQTSCGETCHRFPSSPVLRAATIMLHLGESQKRRHSLRSKIHSTSRARLPMSTCQLQEFPAIFLSVLLGFPFAPKLEVGQLIVARAVDRTGKLLCIAMFAHRAVWSMSMSSTTATLTFFL